MAAAKLHIPVAHIEAGLRSFNRRMPEEINRVLTDHISAVHYCPTNAAVDNLAREGITGGVVNVGDVMYDVTLYTADRARKESRIVERLGLSGECFSVATVHRAENTDHADTLARVIDYLRASSGQQTIVFPLHPRTRAAAARSGLSLEGLTVIPPCGYIDMHRLLQGPTIVYTDSGRVAEGGVFSPRACSHVA